MRVSQSMETFRTSGRRGVIAKIHWSLALLACLTLGVAGVGIFSLWSLKRHVSEISATQVPAAQTAYSLSRDAGAISLLAANSLNASVIDNGETVINEMSIESSHLLNQLQSDLMALRRFGVAEANLSKLGTDLWTLESGVGRMLGLLQIRRTITENINIMKAEVDAAHRRLDAALGQVIEDPAGGSPPSEASDATELADTALRVRGLAHLLLGRLGQIVNAQSVAEVDDAQRSALPVLDALGQMTAELAATPVAGEIAKAVKTFDSLIDPTLGLAWLRKRQLSTETFVSAEVAEINRSVTALSSEVRNLVERKTAQFSAATDGAVLFSFNSMILMIVASLVAVCGALAFAH